jgi:hypothetical protein
VRDYNSERTTRHPNTENVLIEENLSQTLRVKTALPPPFEHI